ncbi:hypothetical protein GQ457_09G018340 [Hibiscus cannabinus]
MTIANPRNPMYKLDPEIKRTIKELRQRARALLAHRNNGQDPVDEQDPPQKNPSAPAGRAIVPPIPQNNQQQLVRTVRDYLAKDLEGLNLTVTIPYEVELFELKPMMFNMLNTLGQFGRSPTENARQHLKSFLEICNSFKIHAVSNDVLKLKLFPYSLRNKTKACLNNLPPGSFQSWTELCSSFLAKQNEMQQYCGVVLKQLRSQRPRKHQSRISAQIFPAAAEGRISRKG